MVGLGLAVIALIYLHLCCPALREYRRDSWLQTLETQAWFLRACLAPLILSVGCPHHRLGLVSAITAAPRPNHRRPNGPRRRLPAHRELALSAITLTRFKAMTKWLVWETLAVAATGALGGFFLRGALAKLPDDSGVAQFAEWFAFLAVPGVLAVFLLTATIFIGLASRFTEEQDREWWGRTGSWILIVMIMWIGTVRHRDLRTRTDSLDDTTGRRLGRRFVRPSYVDSGIQFTNHGSATGRTVTRHHNHRYGGARGRPLFMLCVLIALALGTSWQLDLFAHQYGTHLNDLAEPKLTGLGIWTDPWGHDQVLHNTPQWLLFRFTATVIVLGLLMSVFININRFSLHAMYRNRLIRAYLGASRVHTERDQTFNPFTGFDNLDNPAMSDMRFDEVRLARWFLTQETRQQTMQALARYLQLPTRHPTNSRCCGNNCPRI